MRALPCIALLGFGVLVFAADEPDKTYQFERNKLPKVIKVKAGDKIIVIENIDSENIESIKAISLNDSVKAKADTAQAKVRIVFTTTKKGKAKVGWNYETTNGRIEKFRGLEIEIE